MKIKGGLYPQERENLKRLRKYLKQNNHRQTITDISKGVGLSRPTVSRLLIVLRKKNLIELEQFGPSKVVHWIGRLERIENV